MFLTDGSTTDKRDLKGANKHNFIDIACYSESFLQMNNEFHI